MLTRLFRRGARLGRSLARALRQRLIAATQPAEQDVVVGAVADLVRGRRALAAENAFLRQQLLIPRRGIKRPRCTPADRTPRKVSLFRVRATGWVGALVDGE